MVLSLPLLANTSWLLQPRKGEVVGRVKQADSSWLIQPREGQVVSLRAKQAPSAAQLSGLKCRRGQKIAQDNLQKGNQVHNTSVCWAIALRVYYFIGLN